MKTLSAPADLATKRLYASPLYVVQLEFTAPSAKTLRFADRPLAALGQEWLPFVADWGTLEDVLNTLNVDGRPATAAITFFNTKPIEGRSRLSDLIYSASNTVGAYQWAFAKATVYQLFEGLGSGDEVVLGTFYLEEPTEIGEDLLTVRMSDQSLVLEDALQVTRIQRAEFPEASLSVLDRAIPRVFGVITNVPAIPVVAGVTGRLNGNLTSSATTIPLVDASALPASGTIQIGTEHIGYTGKSGNSLTGGTRGANSTTAAAHTDQDQVMEVRSGTNAYRYVVGEHDASFKTKAITNIKVNGQPAKTAPTVQLDATDIVTGKRFAAISFTPGTVGLFHVLPVGAPRIVSVTTFSITGDGATFVAATRTVALSGVAELPGPTTRRLVFEITSSTTFGTTNEWTLSRQLTGGTAVEVRRQRGDGNTTKWTVSDTLDYPSDADEILTLTALAGSGWTVWCTVTEYAVSYTGAGQRTGASTAELVIGQVTCDVEGIQDDGSGTISGTANLLLENPADITKFLLTQLYGIASASLGSTWAVTRSSLATAALKWAFVLEFELFSALRRRLGEQARSVLYLEGGKWEYEFLPDTPTAQLTLDYLRDVSADVPAVVRRSSRTDIRNSLTLSAQRDYAGSGYRYVATTEDLTQPGLTTRRAADLTLDLVQHPATADALGAFWLGIWKRQRFEIDLIAWWNVLALEKVDYLTLVNHPVLTAHGTLVLRVAGKRYLPGDAHSGRIQLKLIEALAFAPQAPAEAAMSTLMNLVGQNDPTTPNTKYGYSADLVVLRNPSDGTLVVRINTGTLTDDLGLAGPAANGRDQAGAFSASSWIHFYFIWNGTTLATLSSTTAPPTGPTLPSGYTHWAYVGGVRYDATPVLVKTRLRGAWASYEAKQMALNAGAATTETAVNLQAFVPPNALNVQARLDFRVSVGLNGTGFPFVEFRVVSGVDFSALLIVKNAATDENADSQTCVFPNVGQNVYYLVTEVGDGTDTTVFYIDILGYSVPNGGE